MRLLLTTDTVGGVWTFNLQLTRELLTLGCGVTLVSFGWGLSPWQQRQLDELIAQFPARCTFQSCGAALEWMPDNRDAYRDGEALLLRLCTELQPAALLCSQFCWGALPVATPKIVIAHSDVLGWADAVGKAPLAADSWLAAYRTQVQAGLCGASCVTAPTAAMLADLQRNFAIETPTNVIANGLLLPPRAPASRMLQAVSAGRMWDEAKGLALLYNVTSPMPIAVAGEQRSNQEALPAPSRVSLLGPLPHADLLSLFSRSAVYVCTSRYEPFGLAALEAALCGCAVLANDIPSLREVWGDAAYYFTDAAGLSHLLAQFATNADLLAEAQHRASRRAARYTAVATATQYLQLVGELTANRVVSAAAQQSEPAVAA